MNSIEIRPAMLKDLPAILEIYNDVIATSTTVYSLLPSTLTSEAA
jgi:L-amino acid N-acyltransferase